MVNKNLERRGADKQKGEEGEGVRIEARICTVAEYRMI
jgi:hypothetical protein